MTSICRRGTPNRSAPFPSRRFRKFNVIPTKCILCGTRFTRAREEHILPNAVGWAISTTQHVCSDCNARTSADDEALAMSVRAITTLIDPPARRFPAPPLELASNWGRVWLSKGGKVSMPDEVSFTSSDGTPMVSVAEPHMATFEEKMRRRNKSVEWLARHEQQRHVVPIAFEFTVPALRSVTKAALHGAAHLVGGNLVNAPEARLLARFVLSDEPLASLNGVAAWDYDTPDISAKAFYHAVEVTCCPRTGTVVARVHVSGIIRVCFLLGTTYRSQVHRTVSLVDDPFEDQQATRRTMCSHPVAWLRLMNRDLTFRAKAVRDYLAEHRDAITSEEWIDLSHLEHPLAWAGPPI